MKRNLLPLSSWPRLALGLLAALIVVAGAAWGLRFGVAEEKPGARFRQGNPEMFSYIYDTLRSQVRKETLKNASQRLGVKEEDLSAIVSGADYSSLFADGSDLETANRRIDTLSQVRQYFNDLETKLLEAQVIALVHEQSANNQISDAPSDWLVELNQLEETLFKGKQSMRARLEGALRPLATINKKGYLMNKQTTMTDDPNKCKMTMAGFKGPLALGFASTRMPETPPLEQFDQEFESVFNFSAIYDMATTGVAARIGEESITSSDVGNKSSPGYAMEKQLRLSDEGQDIAALNQAAAEEQTQIEETAAKARYQIQREVETMIIKTAKERLGLELENFLGSVQRIAEMTKQMEQVSTQKLQSIRQC